VLRVTARKLGDPIASRVLLESYDGGAHAIGYAVATVRATCDPRRPTRLPFGGTPFHSCTFHLIRSSESKNAFSPSRTSPSPRLPVISNARRDRRPPQKLLQFRLQSGSPRCVESLAAARLQKLPWRPSVSSCGTPRAAAVLTARIETLRDFSQEDQKIRRLDGSPRHSARNAPSDRRRQRASPISRLLSF
jgi:hypothetical protein